MAGITSISIRNETSSGSFGSGAAAFDPKYYLARNADVARQVAGLQGHERDRAALQHFIGHGARELRNPSALFDMKAYVRAYPDVAASGVNPLLHYRTHGRAEGRHAFAVQDQVPQPRGMMAPAADAGVFSLFALPQGGLGHGAMAFQVEAGPGAAPGAVATPEAMGHGAAAMQPPVPVAAAVAMAWPVPQAGGQAVVLPAAGIEAVLPAVQDGHEVRMPQPA